MTARARLLEILSLKDIQVTALDKIHDHYGSEKQVAKMGEEGAELAAAVLKHISRPDSETWTGIVEEMVDVFLLISQVVDQYFTGGDEENFKEMKSFKLNRELGRITNEAQI